MFTVDKDVMLIVSISMHPIMCVPFFPGLVVSLALMVKGPLHSIQHHGNRPHGPPYNAVLCRVGLLCGMLFLPFWADEYLCFVGHGALHSNDSLGSYSLFSVSVQEYSKKIIGAAWHCLVICRHVRLFW